MVTDSLADLFGTLWESVQNNVAKSPLKDTWCSSAYTTNQKKKENVVKQRSIMSAKSFQMQVLDDRRCQLV